MSRFACALFLFAVLSAPSASAELPVEHAVQRLAENVFVRISPVSAGETPARNTGFVVFEDHVLLIDGGRGAARQEALEAVRATVRLPVRFVVDTSGPEGLASTGGEPAEKGPVRIAPETDGSARGERSRPDRAVTFTESLQVADGRTRAELIHVGRELGTSHVAVFLPDAEILFTGDLCFGRSAELQTSECLAVLDRLDRLGARTIVPGHGSVREGDHLQKQRTRLDELRREVATGVAKNLSLESMRIADGDPRLVRRVYDESIGALPPRTLTRDLGLRPGRSATRESEGWTAPEKIVVRDLWPERFHELERLAPGVELVRVTSAADAVREAAGADAVVGYCTEEIVRAGTTLRWIQVGSAGVDRYMSIGGLKESGIDLTNAQRLYGPEMAEHVFAMTLALTRGMHRALPLMEQRSWDRAAFRGRLVELRGKTLLVVGLGGIGTEVARIGHGIGMRVLATRASRREGPPFVSYVGLADELLELAPAADVIVNAAPLTPETEKMFDAAFFRAVKPTAYFVNVGRGRSVDTPALVAALEEARIAGAGLDVTDPEPLPADHALWRMPNVIVTPHVSAGSDVRLERLWMLYRENLRRFVAGEPLLSVVDKTRGY